MLTAVSARCRLFVAFISQGGVTAMRRFSVLLVAYLSGMASSWAISAMQSGSVRVAAVSTFLAIVLFVSAATAMFAILKRPKIERE
jgi:hypothetical protein